MRKWFCGVSGFLFVFATGWFWVEAAPLIRDHFSLFFACLSYVGIFCGAELVLYVFGVCSTACFVKHQELTYGARCWRWLGDVARLFFTELKWLMLFWAAAWAVAAGVHEVSVHLGHPETAVWWRGLRAIVGGWLVLLIVYWVLMVVYAVGRALFERGDYDEK